MHGHHGFGLMGGFGPAMTASFGNFTLSFGGLILSFFNVQIHAFTGPSMYGNGAPPAAPAPGPGHSYGSHHHAHGVPQQRVHQHETGFSAGSPLIIIGLLSALVP